MFVEDEVRLVTFATVKSVDPFKNESGKPLGFEEEFVAEGEVDVVVFVSGEFVFGVFSCNSSGQRRLVESKSGE